MPEDLASKIAELKKDNQNLKRALDNSTSGILVSSIEGRVTFVNETWAKMLGYSSESLLGKPVSIFFSQSVYKDEFVPFLKESENATDISKEFPFVNHKGEKLPVLLKVTALKNDSGEITSYSWTASDLTEQKHKEIELIERTQELEKLNKLMINRELKMVELKEEIESLKKQLEQKK